MATIGPLPAREGLGRRRLARVAAATALGAAALGVTAWLGAGPSRGASAQQQVRTVTVTGRRYAFQPSTIEVAQDELVRIVFTAEDVAHSFTIDQYRIVKRAGAGQTATFEFHADRAGTFTFYCNLKSDEGCRDMRGTLVVRPR